MFANKEDFESLKYILKNDAIKFESNDQKFVGRAGKHLPWIYYHWGISLHADGAILTANCLLEKLQSFSGTQLASYGMTSLPIVTACVTLSQGKYTGLAIRPVRERHGTCRQVEGNGDRSKAVIVVDDCICSGQSTYKAITILENEGYVVEGCLCIINFPWRGGFEWFTALGYKTEYLFDVYRDLKMAVKPYQNYYLANNIKWENPVHLDEKLTPADAARKIIVHYLQTGNFLSAPACFDKNYTSLGGIFISLRDIATEARIARSGIYILEQDDHDFYTRLVIAISRTIVPSAEKIKKYGIEKLKIAVSLLSEQEEILPSQLNYREHGITVQSQVQPNKIGGALPNTQFFTSELEQFNHAIQSAGFSKFEPFILRKYSISKSVESGQQWLPFGVSVNDQGNQSKFKKELINLFRYIMQSITATNDLHLHLTAEQTGFFPEKIKGVAVAFYKQGMLSCWTSFNDNLYEAIYNAASKAWNDTGFGDRKTRLGDCEIQIALSFFTKEQRLGRKLTDEVANSVRLGVDSVFVRKDEKSGIMLGHIPCVYDWTKKKMLDQLLRKAKIKDLENCYWTLYETKTWLFNENEIYELKNGFTFNNKHDDSSIPNENIAVIAEYIVSQIDPSTNLPKYCYWPLHSFYSTNEISSRIILALIALLKAGLLLKNYNHISHANKGIQSLLSHLIKENNTVNLKMPGRGPGAEALLLLLLIFNPDEVPQNNDDNIHDLAQKLINCLHIDGSISNLAPGKRIGADHDILPGVILLALGEYWKKYKSPFSEQQLDTSLEWYKRRFRLFKPWGLTWWHMQAWTTHYEINSKEKYADFVFEIADWVITYQLASGEFLVDYAKSGPGFHTGCVLEGIADAWKLAIMKDDKIRIKKYKSAWQKGVHFMNNLVIYETDTYFMPPDNKAIGGVRESLTSACLRIDFSGHYLLALVNGTRNLNLAVISK
jgi:orotate phosphoribosyltransferase/AMMECR1 domain-containing protein